MAKQMDKARMAEYQRERRAKRKAQAVNPGVNPKCQSSVNPEAPCAMCADKDREIARLTLVNSELRTQLAIDQADRQQARRTDPHRHRHSYQGL